MALDTVATVTREGLRPTPRSTNARRRRQRGWSERRRRVVRVSGGGALACPLCRLNDQMQKVTSVVEGGTSIGTAQGYPYSYSTSSVSNLAARLSIPPAPYANTEPGLEVGMGCGCLVVIVIITWLLSSIGEASNSALLDKDAANAIFLLGIVAWLVFVGFVISRHVGATQRAAAQGQALSRLRGRWQDLYDCHRDDVVFYGSAPSRYASSASMMNLLRDGP